MRPYGFPVRTYGARTWDDVKASRAREREAAAREIATSRPAATFRMGGRIEPQDYEIMPDDAAESAPQIVAESRKSTPQPPEKTEETP